MIAVTLKTPVDILDFDLLLFCPLKENEPGVILVNRIDEFKFVFGFLKQSPTPTPFTAEDVLFEDPVGGFEWTCPEQYKEAQMNRQITLGDVLKQWRGLQDLWICPSTSNIKGLNAQTLNSYFPKERIFIKRAEDEFFKETQQVKECPLNQSLFFYDGYGMQWLVNRKDISSLYIVQVVYLPNEKKLKLKSDVYVMDELILSLFEDYKDLELEDLALSELIRLKNRLLDYTMKHQLPKRLKFSFKTYSKQDIIEWMNPAKFYFDEVSE